MQVCKRFGTHRSAVALEVLGDEDLVRRILPALIFNLDEECLRAAAASGLICGAASIKKHDNQAGTSRFYFLFMTHTHLPTQITSPVGMCHTSSYYISPVGGQKSLYILTCRDTITLIRCGNAANQSGPTCICPSGNVRNPHFTDAYLERHGAAKFSTIVMTPSGYLTDDAWQKYVPFLIQGLRHQVELAAAKLGIDKETASKLLIGLTFDGFKAHVKNLGELVNMADANILALVESRDSSEINQASF